jgi:hypothetical protein
LPAAQAVTHLGDEMIVLPSGSVTLLLRADLSRLYSSRVMAYAQAAAVHMQTQQAQQLHGDARQAITQARLNVADQFVATLLTISSSSSGSSSSGSSSNSKCCCMAHRSTPSISAHHSQSAAAAAAAAAG